MTVIRTCHDCDVRIAHYRALRNRPELKRAGIREHAGRSLCRSCHKRRRKEGTLIDVERNTHSREEVLEEWERLRDQGVTVESAAARLGMTREAFSRALTRAKTLEDSRFHASGVSRAVGRLGTQDGPDRSDGNASTGAYPTEAMTIGRGASMVLAQQAARSQTKGGE